MKQKICLTTLEFPPDRGGVGESAYRIAKMLIDLGYEVHVVVFHYKPLKDRKFTKNSSYKTTQLEEIFVHRLKITARSPKFTETDYFIGVYGQLKALQQEYQFDIFHAFVIKEIGFVTTLIGKEYNLPVINSIRGTDLHKQIFNYKSHSQIIWTLENSDWLTFVSKDLYHRAQILVPSIQAKSSVFFNSIVPFDFSQLPTPDGLEKLQGIVIGSAGRFRTKKGIDFLIDACRIISSEVKLTLLLIGDFIDREREYWQDVIESSGISERIIVTGMLEREQVLSYLPHLDIFAIPSLHDGCPNALLEAMLAGRAIVGTNVDAIGEIIEDGVNGLLVKPSCATELAEAIGKLALSPELRQQFGEAVASR